MKKEYGLKEIDYSKLETLDIVFTTSKWPLANIIRRKEGGKRKDYSVSTHVGMIIDIYGQKLIVEAVGDGVVINSPEKYLKHKKRHGWIIEIKRHEKISLTKQVQGAQFLARLIRKQTEYDIKGLFSFTSRLFKQDPKKYFCSELVAETYLLIGLPIGIPQAATPYGIQRNPHLKKIL